MLQILIPVSAQATSFYVRFIVWPIKGMAELNSTVDRSPKSKRQWRCGYEASRFRGNQELKLQALLAIKNTI
ncbi:MAG: hypothetical protein QM802_26405 [Agriterribacter sp.]